MIEQFNLAAGEQGLHAIAEPVAHSCMDQAIVEPVARSRMDQAIVEPVARSRVDEKPL